MVDLAPEDAASAAGLARALLDGGVTILQLRMKGAEGRSMLQAALVLRALCDEARATFIVNDRLDVALAAGADGVHLGQDDLPLGDARALSPPGFLIGVSTHDEAQARAAAEAGADYLGFGPVFATSTKERPDPVVGLERLAAVCRGVRVPVVAIGGITLEQIAAVAATGARAAAVIRAVNSAPDVVAAARAVAAAFHR